MGPDLRAGPVLGVERRFLCKLLIYCMMTPVTSAGPMVVTSLVFSFLPVACLIALFMRMVLAHIYSNYRFNCCGIRASLHVHLVHDHHRDHNYSMSSCMHL